MAVGQKPSGTRLNRDCREELEMLNKIFSRLFFVKGMKEMER